MRNNPTPKQVCVGQTDHKLIFVSIFDILDHVLSKCIIAYHRKSYVPFNHFSGWSFISDIANQQRNTFVAYSFHTNRGRAAINQSIRSSFSLPWIRRENQDDVIDECIRVRKSGVPDGLLFPTKLDWSSTPVQQHNVESSSSQHPRRRSSVEAGHSFLQRQKISPAHSHHAQQTATHQSRWPHSVQHEVWSIIRVSREENYIPGA